MYKHQLFDAFDIINKINLTILANQWMYTYSSEKNDQITIFII